MLAGASVRDADHVAYEAAIAEAAVKHPAYAVRLKSIPPTETSVKVVSFGKPGPIDPQSRGFDMWVALPDELRKACKGAANPARRLQQILGLPPVAVPAHVVRELQVPREGLIRPCLAGGDLANPYCEFDMAPAPSASSSAPAPSVSSSALVAPSASAPPPLLPSVRTAPSAVGGAAPSPAASADAAPVVASTSSAYDDLFFLAKQMWGTYRVDFPALERKAGDYPYTGFPFTGMGWSYDWSDVPNHIGVSEFVVRRTARITVVSTKTPAEFCAE